MTPFRPVWAEVDLAAVAANVAAIRAHVAPAGVLAVVKADAYGHGAVAVGAVALEAGAHGLAVALVEEGMELRDAGITAPVLVLSEPVPDAADAVVEQRLTPVVYTRAGIEALAKAVASHDATRPLPVHLKVDTGMNRVGCDPQAAPDLAGEIAHRPELLLAGTCTHFAVADEPGNPYTRHQLDTFERLLSRLRSAGIDPGVVHACNTAGALAVAGARFDLVRAGIGIYGIAPVPELHGVVPLAAALALKARVSFVKSVAAGTRVSYGLHYETPRATRIATVPAGYADGVPRNLGITGGEALVHGRRCAIAGTVTMDQLMLDVGELPVEPGDEVVLLGRQGADEITAAEWAQRLGTIPYEIVCGIGARVPRQYVS